MPENDPHNTSNRGHHPDSPSSLQSSEACPHFLNIQRESLASIKGTRQHLAAETRDFTALEDDEELEAVRRCLELEDSYSEQLSEIAPGHKVQTFAEIYLPFCGDETTPSEDGTGDWEGITGGYPDRVFLAGPLGVILDWKFGRIFVTETANNLQGMAYAAALLEKFPELEEVLVRFFHPYLEAEPADEYEHVFSRSDLPEIELRIRAVRAQKKLARKTGFEGPVPACPRTNLCLWCKHLDDGTCREVLKLAINVSAKHSDFEVPENLTSGTIREPADYAAAYRLASLLDNWSKGIKRRCADAAMNEEIEIPGFELVRRQDREIRSLSAVRDEAIRFGLTLEEFETCLTLPITKVEALISEKIKAHGDKVAPRIREFRDNLAESGSVTLSDGFVFLKEKKSKAPRDE